MKSALMRSNLAFPQLRRLYMLIFTDGPEPGRDKRQRSGVVHNVDWLIDIDRKSAFTPDVPLLETALRGTLMYLGIFTLLRVVRRRQRGSLGITDLLVSSFWLKHLRMP